ncbi:MAG TPA: discoidin domain-containing protein [Longimicrobium sp.]|nr:discoidin domain-containing protein [Longimicrobium sp.]
MKMRGFVRFGRLALVPLLASCASGAGSTVTVMHGTAPPAIQRPMQAWMLDGFETVDQWTAMPATGVSLDIAADPDGHAGRAMRLDFDFHGGGGYAVARRAIDIDLPDNYEFSFWVRGSTPPQTLEFKLVDPSGDNVWWVNRRDFVFPDGWTRVVLKKRHLSFAWGPLGGGEMKKAAALEIAVTAGSGGKGSVWIDELALDEREPVRPYDLTPSLTATSGDDAPRALDADPATAWRSAGDGEQALSIDFLRNRELGGLVIDWDSLDYAADYRVEASADGRRWETIYTVAGGDGGRDWLFLPETEARSIRIAATRSGRGRGYALREVDVKPLEWSATRNAFFTAIASEAPRGEYPRYFTGEQTYWTIIGADGDSSEALVGEDGAVEVGKAGFTVEPFLHAGGRLLTWVDGRSTPSLMDGELPIPSVRRDADSLALTVTAFVSPAPGARNASTIWARYRVENLGAAPRSARLFLALRPFQVNPSTQFLNTTGGAAFIREIANDDGDVVIDSTRRVIPITAPTGFGAATFDAGGILSHLRRGALPQAKSVRDPFGHASGAFAYALDLPAGGAREVWIALPMDEKADHPTGYQDPARASADGERALARTAAEWREKLGRVDVILPPSAERIARSIRTNVAFILINRDGPAIQPGSRSYERSWIRDGSLTSTALLRMGHADAVREFAEWYAPFQYANGKVPCCVDRRGADPVPENDSHGQLIYLAAEHYRHTGDRALLRQVWPNVLRAAAYIDTLRQQRRTPRYLQPDSLPYRGLMPQSISHEGYSAKPMHSYWDDFFALRGLKDAAYLAEVLDAPERGDLERMRDEFRADLLASIPRAMALHRIDFIPGAVELGDFDATSTTVGVSPADELRGLPRKPLERTFERYWENFVARRDGAAQWKDYTPYEWRVVGTMVRLGWTPRAHEVIDWFFTHQRPGAWNSWAEVVVREERRPQFLGDMPHTWVGSDFIRSALDLLAYEDEDGSLVIAAGVPEAWVREAPGVGVRDLSTHFGRLSYTMRADGDRVRLRFTGGALRTPPGGIVIRSPMPRPPREVRADGRVIRLGSDGEVRLRTVPRVVEMRY